MLQSVRLVVHAAAFGGGRWGRASSSRALRRASSWTTLAGRATCLGRAATRTRCRCISPLLSVVVTPRGALRVRERRGRSRR